MSRHCTEHNVTAKTQLEVREEALVIGAVNGALRRERRDTGRKTVVLYLHFDEGGALIGRSDHVLPVWPRTGK